MIEMALGKYPYPPETYSNVFAQLTAIVHGDPPDLPEDKYSDTARDFVARCLRKDPDQRATYRELLVRAPMTSPQPMMSSHLLSFLQAHPFLAHEADSGVDMVAWVQDALDFNAQTAAAARPPQPAQPLSV